MGSSKTLSIWFKSKQYSFSSKYENEIFYFMILVPPVQSILPNVSTTIDESTAASDVGL